MQTPRKNIYNVFNFGKNFFFARTLIEIFAIIAALIGVILITVDANNLAPSIIRDVNGNLYQSVTKVYKPDAKEAIHLSVVLIEGILTKGKDNSNQANFMPYADDKVLSKFSGAALNTNAQVTGMFVVDAVPDLTNPAAITVFTEVSLVTWSNSVTRDTSYVGITLAQDASMRSAENPAGWRVRNLFQRNRAFFISTLKETMSNPEERMKAIRALNETILPTSIGDVKMSTILEKDKSLPTN